MADYIEIDTAALNRDRQYNLNWNRSVLRLAI